MKHHANMPMYLKPPGIKLLFNKVGLYRGILYFYLFLLRPKIVGAC